MPKIFKKDCKIKLIEYGTTTNQDRALLYFKTRFIAFYARFFKY